MRRISLFSSTEQLTLEEECRRWVLDGNFPALYQAAICSPKNDLLANVVAVLWSLHKLSLSQKLCLIFD